MTIRIFLRSIRKHIRTATLLAAGFYLAGCLALPEPDRNPGIEIHFIDVGYGDAILVRDGENAMFIDGGYPPMTGTVLEHFRAIGLNRLDALLLTHPHPDHVGGAYGILASGIPVARLLSVCPMQDGTIPEGFRKIVMEKEAAGTIEVTVVKDGDRIELPGRLGFDVVHPLERVPDLNDWSIVIRIDGFGGSVLLTADIGPEAQRRLLTQHPELFPVSILKAPHHGGQSLEDFYRAAQPVLTIITIGINPYGNPWQETLEAATRWSRRVVRTDQSGTIIVRENAGEPDGFSVHAIKYPGAMVRIDEPAR